MRRCSFSKALFRLLNFFSEWMWETRLFQKWLVNLKCMLQIWIHFHQNKVKYHIYYYPLHLGRLVKNATCLTFPHKIVFNLKVSKEKPASNRMVSKSHKVVPSSMKILNILFSIGSKLHSQHLKVCNVRRCITLFQLNKSSFWLYD